MSKKENIILLIVLTIFSIYCAWIIGETWDHADNLLRGKITLDYLFSFGNINYEVFNAGSGIISGLSDVKDVLAKKGDVSKINVDTSKKSSKKLPFDMTAAAAKLNFKPKYDLELGVETLIKWYSK